MKQMKKVLCLALGLAMSLSLLAACSGGGSASPSPSASAPAPSASAPAESGLTTVEAGKLHMSTNAAFPPYEVVKDDGTFEGIDVEVASCLPG